ncbi:MAG TPA: DUF2157 domain-containing protein, partial [Phenylobacterium sp.]|nr:DUF2157 domain-containing protein [Phenylobacterium sp.]
MAGYKARLAKDLDGWIEAGLVPAASRGAILASAAEGRRLDAGAALAILGAVLAGLAVIAFVAANWDAIPRLVRFAMILGAFAAAVAGLAPPPPAAGPGSPAWSARRLARCSRRDCS